ncbi:MAG: radical SAM protein [Rectinemataceae bacterium]
MSQVPQPEKAAHGTRTSAAEYNALMKAVLVQPPFVQLNAPYPAAYYLETYLSSRGIDAVAYDHSIELYRRIFSRSGLIAIFDAAEGVLRSGRSAVGAPLDPASKAELVRYLSYRDLYLEWIDPMVDFLSGKDPGFAHRIGSAAELPRGARASAFLDERGGLAGPDEAGALATRTLDDLGDLVAYAFDAEFGTVRYAERIASSRADFSAVQRIAETSPLMETYYRPYLLNFWGQTPRPDFVLITIPFPGCLAGALACAKSAREAAPNARIILGGGYVSTELRAIGSLGEPTDPGIFDYCDYLAFDSGYGALASILDRETSLFAGQKPAATFAIPSASVVSAAPAPPTHSPGATLPAPLYRTMTRGAGESGTGLSDAGAGESGTSLSDASASAGSAPGASPRVIAHGFEPGDAAHEAYAAVEKEAVRSIFPDYRSVDYSRYLRIADSQNPMHRLWSDTPWLKYHLAHGCYWRKCAFCDTELEYVADFAPSAQAPLMRAASAAADRTGLYGIHFVDEAMPMAGLLSFAAANRARAAAGEKPFHFWGNMRFDASWTPDRCAFLAASGLVAVSGGIEIATERGLRMTDKGFDLAGLVRTLVALKRAGILVHAYLIYGFPGQSESDICDSAEFCRQLFASGLVDSAFWHRFVLTRHSRMYAEWKAGKRPGLVPLDAPRTFADNDLSFEGESAYDRFDAPLAASLAQWMAGEDLERPAAIDNTAPGIAPDLVETLIARAETSIDAAPLPAQGRAHWIAGSPRIVPAKRGKTGLEWAYRGSIQRIEANAADVEMLYAAVSALQREAESLPVDSFLASAGPAADAQAVFTMRSSGLVAI